MSRRSKRGEVTFEKEADLCASFAESAKTQGFKVYPETSGWDLLLVSERESRIGRYTVVKKGDVLGVQAKLRPSLEVLAQSIPRHLNSAGPDFILMAVPRTSSAFRTVAQALRIDVVAPYTYGFGGDARWDVRPVNRHYFLEKPWYPDLEVSMPAGTPAPKSLTKWKIAAIRLCLYAETVPHITILDFERFGVSPHRWIEGGWVEQLPGEGKRKERKYVLSKSDDLPHRRNPEITEALRLRFGGELEAKKEQG